MSSGKKLKKQGQGRAVNDLDKAMSGRKRPKTRADQMSPHAKVIIIIFALLMGVSMMLPSLSYIFGNQQRQSDAAQSADAEQSESTDTSSDSSSDTQSSQVAALDSSYQTRVSKLEEKLNADQNNLAYLLNLGDNYMQWGVSVKYAASTDDERAHATELLNKALDYFARYLEQKDSPAVAVDRALTRFYVGETDAAIADMLAVTQSHADYAPAFANLGMLYVQNGNNDEAKAAFQQAQTLDPEDSTGAKSYADQMLAYMESQANATTQSTGTTTGSTSSTSTATGVAGLSSTLKSISGTTF